METIDLKSIPGYSSKKSYSHFDYRVSFRDVEEKVLNPCFVEHHGFFPLISNTLCHVRYRYGVKTLKTRDIAYAAHLDHRIYQYYALLWGSSTMLAPILSVLMTWLLRTVTVFAIRIYPLRLMQ